MNVQPQPNGRWQQFLAQAEFLAHLRAEFPRFGIIADFRRPIWIAVRGQVLLSAIDGHQLRELLREVSPQYPVQAPEQRVPGRVLGPHTQRSEKQSDKRSRFLGSSWHGSG
jgi:hypothetical protein